MAPRRLSGGWHRCRPTARPLTDGADAARQPCDFRWTAPPPPSSPAIPNGRRFTAQQPCTPPADVADTTRQPFDPQRMSSTLPGSSSIPPADAGLIVAGCTRGASIRATGALRLASAPPNSALPAARQMVRGVFPSASGHGNKSPSRIPQEASDRKKDTSRQYISAMYSNKANHGKN